MSNISFPEYNLDLLSDSQYYVITTLFPRNKSATYKPCLAICKSAEKYLEFEDGDNLFHYACFSNTSRQLSNAILAVKYLDNLKSALFFAKGRAMSDLYHVKHILECCSTAHHCTDKRAHCVTVTNSPFRNDYEILFPCSFIHSWKFDARFTIRHPSIPKDQVQAFAVKKNVDICPFFNINEFKETEKSSKYVDDDGKQFFAKNKTPPKLI